MGIRSKKKRMTKQEFIRVFAKNLGVPQALAEQIIDTYQETILKSLKNYDSLKIGEIVLIEKKEAPEKTRILNGNAITTPKHTVLKARVTKNFKKF